ncbi:hypothetical protein ACFYUL_17935 [Streptomyces sp. NPDC004311]
MPHEEPDEVIATLTKVMFLGIGNPEGPKLTVREADDAPATPQTPL